MVQTRFMKALFTLVLILTLAVTTVANGGGVIELLNVSYDPTRDRWITSGCRDLGLLLGYRRH
jgi:hypothetical protein